MESHGAAGEIQVTETTYRLLRHRYALVDRGLIDVKGKGPMRTYYLTGMAASSARRAAGSRGTGPRAEPV